MKAGTGRDVPFCEEKDIIRQREQIESILNSALYKEVAVKEISSYNPL